MPSVLRAMSSGQTSKADLDEQLRVLNESLKEVTSKFVQDWTGISHLEGILHNAKLEQRENTKTLQSKLAVLQDSIADLRDKESRDRKAGEELSEDIKKLKISLENVRKEADSLLLQKEHLNKRNRDMVDENLKERTELEAQSKATQHTSQELEKAVDYFKDRLGLQLKKVSGGRMQMVLNCIDYKDPAKIFYCFVKIKADHSYEISGCEPPVNDLEELAQKLNDTNNFRAFVITLRQRFKALM